jgi:hypothetical protein
MQAAYYLQASHDVLPPCESMVTVNMLTSLGKSVLVGGAGTRQVGDRWQV